MEPIICKIVLIGDSGVGKTSILNKRVNDKFSYHTSTTVGNGQFSSLKINVKGSEINLKLWDTAGQEKFRTITVQFYRETKGAFLICDLTERQSFENIKFWARQLKNHATDDVIKIILANKCDKTEDIKVTEDEIKQLAKDQNSHYFIVSAQSNQNIIECFDFMAQEIYKHFYDEANQQNNLGNNKKLSTNTESVLSRKQHQSSGCC